MTDDHRAAVRTVTVALGPDLIARIDREVERAQKDGDPFASRSSVIRTLLHATLQPLPATRTE